MRSRDRPAAISSTRTGSGRSKVATITASASASVRSARARTGKPRKLPARLPREDADGLEPQLAEREVGDLRRLARAEERHALGPSLGKRAQAVAQRLPGPPVQVERVGDVLVREPRLLGHAGRREQIAQALPGRGLPRELDDLDRALLGQALEIEVGQAQGHAEPLGERALGQRLALVDGRQDLEIALVLPLHHLFRNLPEAQADVQQLNRSRVEHGAVKDVKPIHPRAPGSLAQCQPRGRRGADARLSRCKRSGSRQCADSTGPDEPAPLALAHRGLPRPRRGDDRLGEHRPPPARVGPRQSPRARAALPSEPRRGPALGGDLRRLRLLPAPGALRGRRPVLRLSRRALDRPGGDAGLPRAGHGGRLRRRPHPVGRPRGAARRVPVRHRALRRVLAAELPARPAARLDRRADPLDRCSAPRASAARPGPRRSASWSASGS